MANTIILPFSELQAELNDEAMIDPNAVIDITENGLYNVAKYGYANVNVEGGGGETWETVFEGSVTTEVDDNINIGEIEGFSGSSADTIKVTFNGVEYTCDKILIDGNNFYGGFDELGDPDFSNYPFGIVGSDLYTETTGTYTLKIEEPQSGGSSDFSTAQVTFENVDITTMPYQASVTSVESDGIKFVNSQVALPITVTVPLYKGINILPLTCISLTDDSYMPTTEGSIEFSLESMGFIVTGDGTIKAKGMSIS